ncbi:MAG: hypothetical protein RR317_04935 [Bilophila sp.]
MSFVQKIANVISKTAGWRVVVPDADGVVRFAMKDGLDMELFSLDGRTAVFRSEIRLLPEHDLRSTQLVQKAAQLAVGVMKKRRSVLSLMEHRLMLHATVHLDSPEALFSETAEHFLNDLAWWRVQLGDASGVPVPSSFTLNSFGSGRS